jgi:hypothetical protein
MTGSALGHVKATLLLLERATLWQRERRHATASEDLHTQVIKRILCSDLMTAGMRALRSFAIDTCVIFYLTLKAGTKVIWMLYAARDIPPLFYPLREGAWSYWVPARREKAQAS